MNRWHITEALGAMLSSATGKQVGLTKAPVLGSGQTYDQLVQQGYYVLYPISGTTSPGAMDGTFPIRNPVFQITSVGRNQAHADLLAGRASTAMFDRTIPVTSSALSGDGVTVMARLPNSGPYQPQEPSDGVVSVAERFTVPISQA